MTAHATTGGAARNGEVEIVYEVSGPADGQPVLLVMGIGGQLASWPDGFVRALVDRGMRVARFDNRDAGLSTHLTGAGRPRQLTMVLRPAAAAVYTLDDMAADAVAVLDALGWESAHVVGMSQGGMIGQVLAVRHPDRVRTLTSIASTPSPKLGRPRPRTLARIVKVANPRRVKDRDGAAQYAVDLESVVGSPAYPGDEDELRAIGRRTFDRGGIDLPSAQRQTAAIAASGDRTAELARITVPTLVVHGEADPFVLPAAGRATAKAIPGARLVTYPGMGHHLPPALRATVADEIAALAAQVDGAGAGTGTDAGVPRERQ